MLLLTSTNDKLQIITSTATAVDVHASWVDNNAGTITPGRTNTAISTAATTDVVAAPLTLTARNVQTLSIRNKDGALSQTVTVRHTDGTTIVELIKVSLWAGQELYYIDGEGWEVLDSQGNVLQTTQNRKVQAVYDAQADFGFVGDLVSTEDGACSSGTPSKITSATAAFTTNAVVGQRITLSGAGASGAQYVGSITSIDSAIQVGVSPNITTTVSGKGLWFGTDNTAAITAMQNAINNATFPGALVMFGRSVTNAYGFPTKVSFTQPVQIDGIGGGHTADSGNYTRQGGTRLAWWGQSVDSGTIFTPFVNVTSTGVQSLKRVCFRHVWLDCRNGDQNEALIGLKLASCQGFMLYDFYVNDPLAIGIWTNISSTPTEAKDTTRFTIQDICVRALDNPQAGAVTTPILMTSAVALTTTPQSLTVAANTLPASGYAWVATNLGYPVLLSYTGGGGTVTLTGCTISAEDLVNAPSSVNGSNVVQAVPGNACAILFDGGTTANTCCGVASMLQISHGTTWGPAAIEFRNSDSVDVIQAMINGGNATNDGAINRVRKPGVRLNGSNTNATLAARNNTFRGGSAGVGGVCAMGLLNTGVRMTAMTGPHYWDAYQLGNGETIPVVEGNGFFEWYPNGGLVSGPRGTVLITDQAVPAATLTTLTGSLIAIPPQGWQIGTKLRWKFRGSKTAAGLAARNFFIKIGTAGTTADATIATFLSTGTPSAAIDNASWEVELTIRTLGAGTATGVAHLTMMHGLAATGFSNQAVEVNAGSMVAFNSTVPQLFVSMALTTGAAEAITFQSMGVECINPANP